MSSFLDERFYPRQAKIGFFAVSHAPYNAQFPGLYDSFRTYHEIFRKKLLSFGVEVIDLGIIDREEDAFAAARRLAGESPDLIVCNMITYATSSVFAPFLTELSVPVILAALQPRAALDYTKANTRMQLENDNICAVPEFTGVARRLGRRVEDCIIGTLEGDAAADAALAEWCDIAKVLNALRGARIGLLGHTMEAMYDMHADPTALTRAFGIHVPLLEIDDILRCKKEVTKEEIALSLSRIDEVFDTPDPGSDPIAEKLTDRDKTVAAVYAAALERLIEEKHLRGLAYYYEGTEGEENREAASSLIVGNSFLNARGVPMCGEYDIKTCIAMLIMDTLGIGGSFAELHPFDFAENFILVGHDGPHHIAIAEGRPALRSLKKYHGKPGSGASVEFKLREGDITLFGIGQDAAGGFRFIVGEGTSEHGPIPPTGNTNTRARFLPTTKEFVRRWVMAGPTHHFALGIGHRAATIEKIAAVLGIPCVNVSE